MAYVLRRFVCGIPTNSLNKTFSNLYKYIDKSDYLNSLKVAFILMSNYKIFPNDTEFKKDLKEKDLYNTRNRNFWLRQFENYNRKERSNITDYTIEHIMPQNPKLSDDWKKELGEDWKNIHQTYLHTLGNLTLTGYNSELSDKSFSDKKTIDGGFDESTLRLNISLQNVAVWNKEALLARSENLTERMIDIWPYPQVAKEVIEKYKPDSARNDNRSYTVEDHTYLLDGPMKNIFKVFRKRVLDIDSSVREEFLKKYVAYKADTNFVDVVPQKSKLRLSLSIDYDEIYDPEELCINVTNKGGWRNRNTEVHLSSLEQLDYIMSIIQQSFDNNSEN